MARGMRGRLGVVLSLAATLVVGGCGALATPNASLCPAPPLKPPERHDYATEVGAYNGAGREWQTKVNETQQRAAITDATTVASFVERTQAAIRTAAPVQDPIGTDIYGGLAVAGGVFGAN